MSGGIDSNLVTILIAILVVVLVVTAVVAAFGKWFRSSSSPVKYIKDLLSAEIPIRITTAMSADAAERRLRDRITRFGVPFVMSKRLVGKVGGRNIKVRLHRPFLGNSAAPIFVGSIRRINDRTEISGFCRLPLYFQGFMKFWFGFLAIWSAIGIPAGILMLITGQIEGALFVAAPAVMFGFGVIFVKFGLSIGSKDYELIKEKPRNLSPSRK